MSQWSDAVFTFDLTQHLFKSFVAVSERRQTEKSWRLVIYQIYGLLHNVLPKLFPVWNVNQHLQ